MNLTLSIDERVVARARRVAQSMDKSQNQLIHEYLEQLVSEGDAQQECEELRRLSAQGQGYSKGWKFNRNEIHERS